MNYEQMIEQGENALLIENQQNDTSDVTVREVTLSVPGYVVLFDDDQGVPGSIIGYSLLLQSGVHEDVQISLETFLQKEMVYYAILYHDDGDNTFSQDKDTQVIDSTQSIVLMNFVAF